jgi:hypothetical protein|uniref:Uncharacterized protein n=1 Tax=Zea mays TaxID=4577 RepID=A0A804UHQ8_MAIZE
MGRSGGSTTSSRKKHSRSRPQAMDDDIDSSCSTPVRQRAIQPRTSPRHRPQMPVMTSSSVSPPAGWLRTASGPGPGSDATHTSPGTRKIPPDAISARHAMPQKPVRGCCSNPFRGCRIIPTDAAPPQVVLLRRRVRPSGCVGLGGTDGSSLDKALIGMPTRTMLLPEP